MELDGVSELGGVVDQACDPVRVAVAADRLRRRREVDGLDVGQRVGLATSNTDVARKATRGRCSSSSDGPVASSPVFGRSGIGARICRPRSPRRTHRPSFSHALNPTTYVGSSWRRSHCQAISMRLFALYRARPLFERTPIQRRHPSLVSSACVAACRHWRCSSRRCSRSSSVRRARLRRRVDVLFTGPVPLLGWWPPPGWRGPVPPSAQREGMRSWGGPASGARGLAVRVTRPCRCRRRGPRRTRCPPRPSPRPPRRGSQSRHARTRGAPWRRRGPCRGHGRRALRR